MQALHPLRYGVIIGPPNPSNPLRYGVQTRPLVIQTGVRRGGADKRVNCVSLRIIGRLEQAIETRVCPQITARSAQI